MLSDREDQYWPIWSTAGSTAGYSIIWLLILRSSKSMSTLTNAREALSLCHCSVVTALTAICMWHNRDIFIAAPTAGKVVGLETDVAIITAKTFFGNQITGFETGYLIADSLALLYTLRLKSRSPALRGKNVNYLHLLIHHIGICAALLFLQYRLVTSRVKGMLLIAAMHLMNASSIPGTVRWFLINHTPHRRNLILAVTAAYLTSFAVFRISLFPYMIWLFGRQMDKSFWQALGMLYLPCKLGVGAFLSVNAAWLFNGIRNFVKRVRVHTKVD